MLFGKGDRSAKYRALPMLIALFMCLAGCGKADLQPNGPQVLETSGPQASTPAPTEEPAPAPTAEPTPEEKTCDAVFYGDSITAGNNFDELFPELNIVDCGHGGATIQDLTELAGELSEYHPLKIFVMAGGNNLNSQNVDECVELYRGLLDALQEACPYSEIFVESMLPVDKAIAASWDCPNRVVREFNGRLEELAAEYGMVYIEIYPAYEVRGGLNSELSSDGVHLDPDAFGPWAEIVRPYLEH